jgi:hypothetical protein
MSRRRWGSLIFLALLAAVVMRLPVQALWEEPEIAVEMGGTYEDMLKRSSALFTDPFFGHAWFGIPKVDARLRFLDPQYGFTTPLARFFTVSFDDKNITSLRMSPQIEPLLIDDALKVVLDLQDQWRHSGWINKKQNKFPEFADTPHWRAQLRDINKEGKTYWYAGDRYQALLMMARFKDSRRPEEERYMITLSVARPWTPFP